MIIKSINPVSLGKFVGVILAAQGLLVSLMLLIFGGLISSMTGMYGGYGGYGIGIGSLITFPLLFGILGFIGGIVTAIVYNFFAGIIGGIEINVD